MLCSRVCVSACVCVYLGLFEGISNARFRVVDGGVVAMISKAVAVGERGGRRTGGDDGRCNEM